MERKELLDIIKSLHNGEKIRIEYKPLFSKRVLIDTEYLGLIFDFDLLANRKISMFLYSRGDDYNSLTAGMYDTLFNYIKLECADSDGVSVMNIPLRQITQLKIIG